MLVVLKIKLILSSFFPITLNAVSKDWVCLVYVYEPIRIFPRWAVCSSIDRHLALVQIKNLPAI